jgi:hypothetical protein
LSYSTETEAFKALHLAYWELYDAELAYKPQYASAPARATLEPLIKKTLTDWLEIFIEQLPVQAYESDLTFSFPLIHIMGDVRKLVARLAWHFYTDQFVKNELFVDLRNQLDANINKLSKVPMGRITEKQARKIISPLDFDGTPEETIQTYLKGTPLILPFYANVAFTFPDEQRFAGMWCLAPSGTGKTNLLLQMFFNDLPKKASIILMDSKGELIDSIKDLDCISDRLILIEPSLDVPLALNPLDIPHTDLVHTIGLVEYIMSALLEAKFTPLQSTLFRNVIPAVMQIPDATLETFKTVMAKGLPTREFSNQKLDPHIQAFFDNRETGFHSETYKNTKREVVWRIDFLMTNPLMRAMFTAAKTRLDIGKEMDAGKIIIINNSKALLDTAGSEFFSRFFITLILAAAQRRSLKKADEKIPCYVYIDECHTAISGDASIPTILDECRSQKIALILAHQRTAQLTPPVLDAVSNCAIRIANSDDEAKYMAEKLRSDTDTLRSLPRGSFATFVRDMTPQAITLTVPKIDLSKFPKMSKEKSTAIKAKMREQFSIIASNQAPKPAPAPPTAQHGEASPVCSPQPGSDTPEASSTW